MKLIFRFLQPNPDRRTKKLAEVGIEFTEDILKGTRLIGFTINENDYGIYVSFPSYVHKKSEDETIKFNFLWGVEVDALEKLEDYILDEYEKQADKLPPVTRTVQRTIATPSRVRSLR